MVRITEELIRRKAEHNECEIGTLEEIALHQENIEKIEHIQNWCTHLQILLLQSNLIARIENLWKLKRLQYLNLALNNIERIENLEGLESLEKLDLTLNFIGELTSVRSLQGNIHLKVLILTGNPCTDYNGYREYTVTAIPQIRQLDDAEITRSERILARQRFDETIGNIEEQQEGHRIKRVQEKMEEALRSSWDDKDCQKELSPEEIDRFWKEESKNTPEERVRIAKRAERIKQHETREKKETKEVRLFAKDGTPFNVNQPKIPFTLTDNEVTGCKVLDIAVYKHLDSSFIDVDLHPKYITVRIKGQVFQMTFYEEISPDKSTCQRSQTTGHLVVTMPITTTNPKSRKILNLKTTDKIVSPKCDTSVSKRELLEIGPASQTMDFSNICKTTGKSDNEDEEEVPPLE